MVVAAGQADEEALVKAARRFGEQHLAPFYKRRESDGAYDRQTLRHMGNSDCPVSNCPNATAVSACTA
jgi:hypothetical protein